MDLSGSSAVGWSRGSCELQDNLYTPQIQEPSQKLLGPPKPTQKSLQPPSQRVCGSLGTLNFGLLSNLLTMTNHHSSLLPLLRPSQTLRLPGSSPTRVPGQSQLKSALQSETMRQHLLGPFKPLESAPHSFCRQRMATACRFPPINHMNHHRYRFEQIYLVPHRHLSAITMQSSIPGSSGAS